MVREVRVENNDLATRFLWESCFHEPNFTLDLLQRLNHEHAQVRGEDDALTSRIEAMETAFRMQFEASEVFDLSREPQYLRDQ